MGVHSDRSPCSRLLFIVNDPPLSRTTSKPILLYSPPAGLSIDTLSDIHLYWPRLFTKSRLSRSDPTPFPLYSGNTAIDNSGVSSSKYPYPFLSPLNRRTHTAPIGCSSSPAVAIYPLSPRRPHP